MPFAHGNNGMHATTRVLIGRAADAGDGSCAMAVEWYARHPSDSEGFTFRWGGGGYEADSHAADKRFLINPSKLQACFRVGRSTVKPIQAALNEARRTDAGPQKASRADQLWELGRDVHAQILRTL